MGHDYHGAPVVNDPADFTGADAQYAVTPEGAGYEHTDANVWTIVKFGVWLAVAAVVIHLGLGVAYQMMISRTNESQAASRVYPLAPAQPAQPPLPRLQQFPQIEAYQFRTQEEARLNGYGWVNKDAGTVHIPIADAMRLTVQRGLSSRAVNPSQPDELPGMMPTDASSGRVMERRRQ